MSHPGAHAATSPDKPAYVMGSTGLTVTYRELNDESNRLAQLFADAGLRPGDHVAFMLENHPRFFQIAWAAQRSGLYYTAISSRLTEAEASYIIQDCEAQVFVTSAALSAVATQLVDKMPDVRVRLMLDGTVDGYEPYEEVVGRYPAEPIAEEVEGADMLYSSGTTGRPKGVQPPLTGAALGAPHPIAVLGQMLLGFDENVVYLSPAPLYHAAPLRFSMAVHRLGGTVIVMEHFDPIEALRLIERYKVTASQWVPTMFIRMLKLPEEERTRYDLSSHKAAVHAAAPCPVEVKEKMIEWWGPIIHEYYAGTEGNGFVYTNSEDWLAHKGSVGKALVGQLHIVDDEGEELPPGEPGTVYFSDGADFEYHNDPEKTASSRDPKGRGWTTLGDVGRLDEDGFLYLTDRKAYMIISGGVNIYPQEAENVLAMHPKIADVAVIGVPNEDFGEEVKAVVELIDKSEASEQLGRELIEYCKEQLASFKCPRSVDFVDELPRHPTGKLYKRLVRDKYWEGHTSRI